MTRKRAKNKQKHAVLSFFPTIWKRHVMRLAQRVPTVDTRTLGLLANASAADHNHTPGLLMHLPIRSNYRTLQPQEPRCREGMIYILPHVVAGLPRTGRSGGDICPPRICDLGKILPETGNTGGRVQLPSIMSLSDLQPDFDVAAYFQGRKAVIRGNKDWCRRQRSNVQSTGGDEVLGININILVYLGPSYSYASLNAS